MLKTITGFLLFLLSLFIRFVYFPILKCFWKLIDDDSSDDLKSLVQKSEKKLELKTEERIDQKSDQTSEQKSSQTSEQKSSQTSEERTDQKSEEEFGEEHEERTEELNRKIKEMAQKILDERFEGRLGLIDE